MKGIDAFHFPFLDIPTWFRFFLQAVFIICVGLLMDVVTYQRPGKGDAIALWINPPEQSTI